jgi:hypothetical protein
MIRAIAYTVMVVSAVGVIACFLLHVASFFAGPEFGQRLFLKLFIGLFIVWLPTVLLMNRLTRDFKQRDLWKAALRGCPGWMQKTLWVVWGYVFFAAFILPFLRGSNPGASPGSFLIFPAVFYSTSFGLMYSLLHVDQFDGGRRCLNGHSISPLAKFCEECGAPAAPDSTISSSI